MSTAQIGLGTGVYSIPDAALILRVPLSKLRRWVVNSELHEYDMLDASGNGRERVFNFNTLIEAYTVYTLRGHGVSMQKIRHAHKELAIAKGCEYPFALKGVLTDGRSVLFDQEDSYVNLNEKRQREFKQLINQFCKKVDFEDESMLAERYWPLGRNKSVVVDPHHSFGRPVLSGTNISTQAVYALHISGEKHEDIACQYDIDAGSIDDVLEFYNNAA